MESVEKEIDKLLNKFKDLDKQTAKNIEDCIQQLNEIHKELSEGNFVLHNF